MTEEPKKNEYDIVIVGVYTQTDDTEILNKDSIDTSSRKDQFK